MTSEDVENRLRRYGDILDAHLGHAPQGPPINVSGKAPRRRWVRPVLVAAAVVGVLGIVGVLALRDGSDQSGLITADAEDPTVGADSPDVRECREGYAKVVRDFGDRDDGSGPAVDLTVADARAVVMRDPADPEVTTVFLPGETYLVSCRIPDGGVVAPIPDLAIGATEGMPPADGVQIVSPRGGFGVTNGPVTLRLYGRVGVDVQGVTLRAEDTRSPGVVQQGWFLVQITLEGSLKDFEEISLEWTTSSGAVNSEVLFVYDEAQGELVRFPTNPTPGPVPTLQAGPSDVEFAACPASADPYSDITGSQVLDLLNTASGSYSSADELLAISCVWSPDSQLHRQDESGSLAQNWANAVTQSSSFEMENSLAVGLGSITQRSVEGVVIDSVEVGEPVQAVGLNLRWTDGRWLITDWTYQPTCEALLAAATDPQLPDPVARAIEAQCG